MYTDRGHSTGPTVELWSEFRGFGLGVKFIVTCPLKRLLKLSSIFSRKGTSVCFNELFCRINLQRQDGGSRISGDVLGLRGRV